MWNYYVLFLNFTQDWKSEFMDIVETKKLDFVYAWIDLTDW